MVFRLTPEPADPGRKKENYRIGKSAPAVFFRLQDSRRFFPPDSEGEGISPSRQAEGGFSLLEAIIAIALIGSALIISMAFLNTLAIAADHLRTQIGLMHEVEGSLELMRAGHIPLETGIINMTGNSMATLRDLRVTVLVEPEKTPGLYLVTIRAECSFRRRRLSRRLISEIWSP